MDISKLTHADRSEVLVQALPYIQHYHNKTVVIKYGGNAMINEDLQDAVMTDIVLLRSVGINVVLVHGGGPEINEMLNKIGKETEFINGLRVTDEETLGVAGMVLSKVNKSLVSMLQQLGMKAVGLSGKDAGLLQVKKKLSGGKDIGYVGEVVATDSTILDTLISNDFIPVIAPIGLGIEDYHGYNINADDAACAIATALNAEKLVFLTDIEGLYKDINDKDSFISRITATEADNLIEEGFIGGGMLPKLNNCTSAVKNGVNRVHILDGRIPHCLLLEIFTNEGVGTAIVRDED